MKYKVIARLKNGTRYESELPIVSLGYALHEAERMASKSKVVTILTDREGIDHADNAGKYFLYQIIK